MMKRIVTVLALAAAALSLNAKDILVNTPNTTLLLKADEGKSVRVCYYGERVNDVKQVYKAVSLNEEAYPAFGYSKTFVSATAISIRHADGDLSTQLLYTGDSVQKEGNSTVYTINTKDSVHKVEVDLCYRTYDNCDVIETWTVIRNCEKKPIVLNKYASGYLPVRQGDVWVSHQHGKWGAESYITEEPLNSGCFEVHDLNGTKNAFLNRPNIMLSLDGKPQENSGRTIGAVLCWGGNFRMSIDTDGNKLHHLVCGINELNSQYTLEKGTSFTTPALALVYSNEGKGGVSRNYHRWARLDGKVHNGTALRKTLLNSWEGVYLNVSQEGMEKMMDGVQAVGAELFVMDDGWFGNKYKRSTDDRALGDWVTDVEKIPAGIPALQKAAADRGLAWGIWIEPEMTNKLSELYEAHPGWVICHPDRTPIYGRGGTQMTLDMSNPEVQDFVVKVVDDIMTDTPETYYIKWDCNSEFYSFGSSYLGADRQSHLYVDYHLGLIKALERIRAKYPDLVIQCCASGGGRVNYGLMPYFDEFWVSDNTDAIQRLYIQWGTSMFFPTCAMAQHVSASPNHQTGRSLPLKFRFDVAMTGRLGMEMKPSDLNEKELAFAKNAFETYKKTIRPIVQQGDLYRLISPYEGKNFASEMFVNDDKSEAIFFAFKMENFINMMTPRFRFAGLDPDAEYQLVELCRDGKAEHWEGGRFTGRFLMDSGIEISFASKAAHSSRVIDVKRVR